MRWLRAYFRPLQQKTKFSFKKEYRIVFKYVCPGLTYSRVSEEPKVSFTSHIRWQTNELRAYQSLSSFHTFSFYNPNATAENSI